jgi:hypothetical protein
LLLQPELSDHVNSLLEFARANSRKWDRCDVFAALVFNGPRSEAEMLRLFERYERALVGQVRVRGRRSTPASRRPGRVPRSRPTNP